VTEARGHGICKEMPVIPVSRVVDKKRIICKSGGPRRGRGTRGHCLPPPNSRGGSMCATMSSSAVLLTLINYVSQLPNLKQTSPSFGLYLTVTKQYVSKCLHMRHDQLSHQHSATLKVIITGDHRNLTG
jgi:hypothetical protein